MTLVNVCRVGYCVGRSQSARCLKHASDQRRVVVSWNERIGHLRFEAVISDGKMFAKFHKRDVVVKVFKQHEEAKDSRADGLDDYP